VATLTNLESKLAEVLGLVLEAPERVAADIAALCEVVAAQ
jgi:hypothetical protein